MGRLRRLPVWIEHARAVRICATVLLALAIAVTGVLTTNWAGFSAAYAQDRESGLLELLFNREKRQERARQLQPQGSTRKVIRRTSRQDTRQRVRSTSRSSVASAPREVAVEKNDSARKVLVIGDFVANGLARGLVDAFAASPNVVIERRTNGSSGFVRDDFYNWPGEIGAILDEVQPSVLVVHLGANDRQPLRVEGRTHDVLSDSWRTEYTARIDAFIDEVRQKGVVLVWTGAPPFRFRSMSADMERTCWL